MEWHLLANIEHDDTQLIAPLFRLLLTLQGTPGVNWCRAPDASQIKTVAIIVS